MLEKINLLIDHEAEEFISEIITELSDILEWDKVPDLYIAINIGDDIGGAWTTRFATGYKSEYRIKSLLKKEFWLVYIWAGEAHSKEYIEKWI